MMNYSYLLLINFLLLSSMSNVFSQQKAIQIGSDYEVKFSGTGASGSFKGLEGTIQFDPKNLKGSLIDVTIDAATIDTGNGTKNKHAKGKNWFFVSKFPKINFHATEVTKQAEGYLLKGDLELHGVKKEVEIPFTYQVIDHGALMEGTFKIDRNDFKIFGPFFGFVVGDEFKVDLKIPVTFQ